MRFGEIFYNDVKDLQSFNFTFKFVILATCPDSSHVEITLQASSFESFFFFFEDLHMWIILLAANARKLYFHTLLFKSAQCMSDCWILNSFAIAKL